MRTLIKVIVFLLLLGVLGFFSYGRLSVWLAERNKPIFRTAAVEMGDLRLSVNASGEVNPVLSVKIGSFVSGPIEKLYVDFNDEVKKGDPLADIDPRIYAAAVARDEAALATRLADVERVKAELQRAINDEKRSISLKTENPDYIAQTELDQYRFARLALDAQVKVAEAGVLQAEANLKTSQANVDYTKILSPVDGMVIDRKIDPGQTLAASFQTPELFVIAPDLREKVYILAAVDEADIGQLYEAKKTNQPVYFTVDAYPSEIFNKGYIEQIRLSPKVSQNVVTYPVIVATENPDMKLLPGMTAMITFQVRELKNVIKVPNAAVRYFPDKAHVRESDQHLLDLNLMQEPEDESESTSSLMPPVDDSAKAVIAATKRVVWVEETAAEASELAQKKAVSEAASKSTVAATSNAPPIVTEPAVAAPVIATSADVSKAAPAAVESAPQASSAEVKTPEASTSAGSKPSETASSDTAVNDATQVASTIDSAIPVVIAPSQTVAVPMSGKLKAIHVVIGESDYQFTHVISGDLKPGDKVIVGIKPPGAP